jgi:hypothetical protein
MGSLENQVASYFYEKYQIPICDLIYNDFTCYNKNWVLSNIYIFLQNSTMIIQYSFQPNIFHNSSREVFC